MELSTDQEMTNAATTATEMLPAPTRTKSVDLDNGPYAKVARSGRDAANSRAVFEIFIRYLSVKSLGRAMCVCKSWQAVAASEEGLWHRHCALLYPALLSPAVSKQISETCGFHKFFLNRLLPPARAPKLPFSLDELTFFLDISYHGSPVFSHVFRYEGGNAVVPYSPDCYVDSGAVFPASDSLDKDAFRRTMTVNWTVMRRTDGKGTCIVRSIPDRSSSSSMSFDALLAAVPNSGSNSDKANSGNDAPTPGVGAVAVVSPRPNATQKTQSNSQLPALKLVFSTNLGGPVGEQFYGMMKVSFALPVRERFLHQRSSSSSSQGGSKPSSNDVTPVNVLSRSGGLEIGVSALKDRLGGTVRVDISGKEFLLILAALQWV